MPDQDDTAESIRRLHLAGWTVGDTAFLTSAGVLAWVVYGRNGENLIRAEGPTCALAWLAAIDRAREMGMLDGVRPGEPGAG